MDANEAFPDPDQTGWRAGTGGNYHGRRSTPWPEHTTTQPGDNRTTPTASARRLPHRRAHFKEGSRHLARSDSWPGLGRHGARTAAGQTQTNLKIQTQADLHGVPRAETDTHRAIEELAQQLTSPGKPSERFRESTDFKLARRRARGAQRGVAACLKTPTAGGARLAQQLVCRAGHFVWSVKRALTAPDGVATPCSYSGQRRLAQKSGEHFHGNFAKAPVERTASQLGDTCMAFTRLCKRTGGNHLRLEASQGHKPRRDNARGPGLLMDQSAWQSRILHMPHPLFWINIRPITLISAVLKWFSQFLLRGSATASRGKQATQGWGRGWQCRSELGRDLHATERVGLAVPVAELTNTWAYPSGVLLCWLSNKRSEGLAINALHERKSFELWNPGWEVRALDEQSLPDVLGEYCKQFTEICKAAFSVSRCWPSCFEAL